MGNRKRARRSELSLDPETTSLPDDEKELIKVVPANIKWATVPTVDRDDVETVGEQAIYSDGTTDVVVYSDISSEARELLGITEAATHFSIGPDIREDQIRRDSVS